MSTSVDEIPVAYTPPGGWTTWPAPVLAGCDDPIPDDAPDLDGLWQVTDVRVDDAVVETHPLVGSVQRIEQRGDRVVVTSGGVIHDMRCDGVLEHGVVDVAAADKETPLRVTATYEDGVHVLRPEGTDIEVRRWRDCDDLLWDYAFFVARLERIGDSDVDPATLPAP